MRMRGPQAERGVAKGGCRSRYWTRLGKGGGGGGCKRVQKGCGAVRGQTSGAECPSPPPLFKAHASGRRGSRSVLHASDDCYLEGYNLVGNAVVGHTGVTSTSAQDCQVKCQTVASCLFFTFDLYNEKCYLKTSDSGKTATSTEQHISGPKRCSGTLRGCLLGMRYLFCTAGAPECFGGRNAGHRQRQVRDRARGVRGTALSPNVVMRWWVG